MSIDSLRVARLAWKRRELHDRLARIDQDLGRGDDGLPTNSDERAPITRNDEVLERIQTSAAQDLAAISHAMHRIEEGHGDECEDCGQPIDARRIESVPWAVRCAGCERHSSTRAKATAAPSNTGRDRR